MSPADLKQAAARKALDLVEPGMKVGLGTGSTAAEFVKLLGERVAAGLDVAGVPTSAATARLAREAGVPLIDLDDAGTLDLTVDGADEIDGALRLIKGGGGALLREKLVARASRRMAVVADESKLVETLGAFPLPVEIVPFGVRATIDRIAQVLEHADVDSRTLNLRMHTGKPFLTDGGHMIVDCALARIGRPDTLADALKLLPGIVDHGLFLDLASCAIVAGQDGVRCIDRPDGGDSGECG